MMIRYANRLSLFLLSALCAACLRAPVQPVDWPDELPPLNYYDQTYNKDQHNRKIQPREDYLTWVIRFYEGWDLYQDGWLVTSRDILLGIDDPAVRKRVKSKLFDLGRLLSAEWAKASRRRTIRTRELSIWGQALLKALDHRKQEPLVDRVIRDVNGLLSRRLDRTEINIERYFDSAYGGAGDDHL